MRIPAFFYLFRSFWKTQIAIIVLGLVAGLLGLAIPYLGKLVIDQAYVQKDGKLFILLCLLIGGSVVFMGLLNGAAQYLSGYVKERLGFDLSRRLFRKIQGLPYASLQELSTGKSLYNLSYDLERVSLLVAQVIPGAVVLVPKSVLTFGVLCFMNMKMAFLAFALTPVLYIVPYFFNRIVRKIFQAWVQNSQDIFQRLQEELSHIQLVKALGAERRETRHYVERLVGNLRLKCKSMGVEVAGMASADLANHLVLGVIIFYGGYEVLRGQMSIGSLGAIVLYLNQLSGLQQGLAGAWQEIVTGSVSYRRIEALLNMPVADFEDRTAGDIVFSTGRIEFRDVSFFYGRACVLNRMNFVIDGGLCVSLAGPSGCGKTTMGHLLLRLYAPQRGAVLIDGHDIKTIKSRALHAQIGVALQDPHLWNDSIKNNILYASPAANREEMYEAARVAGIDDFIATLPDGYDTVIGENACKISEGQKQRIALARAIVSRPRILILDEALSSVEPQKEAEIIRRLRDFLKGATMIVVSHRPSTIEQMDKVCLWVDSGRVDVLERRDIFSHPAYQRCFLK